jgi:hypothetical protein
VDGGAWWWRCEAPRSAPRNGDDVGHLDLLLDGAVAPRDGGNVGCLDMLLTMVAMCAPISAPHCCGGAGLLNLLLDGKATIHDGGGTCAQISSSIAGLLLVVAAWDARTCSLTAGLLFVVMAG